MVEPFDSRMLPVDPPHEIYVEQVGKRDGLPVVFLHGGPGGGCQPHQRRLFDTKRFHAVFFDQRGAGRSTPRRCLELNTTAHLIQDLETIREALEIERWMVVGGSWGSLLGLAYAQAHPQRVTGLVLRAVFLGTPEEIDWALIRAPQVFYPDLWRALMDLLPADERDAPLAALGRRLDDPDPAVHGPAAWVWHDYERTLSVLSPGSLALPASLNGATLKNGALPDSPCRVALFSVGLLSAAKPTPFGSWQTKRDSRHHHTRPLRPALSAQYVGKSGRRLARSQLEDRRRRRPRARRAGRLERPWGRDQRPRPPVIVGDRGTQYAALLLGCRTHV